VAALNRGVLLDSLAFTGRLLEGDHMNVYASTVLDGGWEALHGYGFIQNGGGRVWATLGSSTVEDGFDRLEQDRTNKVQISLTDNSRSWTVNGSTHEKTGEVLRSNTRQVALGSWGSTVAFDNIVVEGVLGAAP